MATKVMLINKENVRFLFKSSGEVYINDVYKGAGILVTPIEGIGLRKTAQFCLEHKNYSTGQLKGCLIDD